MVIMMSESIVARYLKYATTVMVKNNDTGIKCPCRSLPFTGGLLWGHQTSLRDWVIIKMAFRYLRW